MARYQRGRQKDLEEHAAKFASSQTDLARVTTLREECETSLTILLAQYKTVQTELEACTEKARQEELRERVTNLNAECQRMRTGLKELTIRQKQANAQHQRAIDAQRELAQRLGQDNTN
jgi:hypothetical protein